MRSIAVKNVNTMQLAQNNMNYNKYNFAINKMASNLKKNPGRVEISGVLVEPDATVATDSYRLIKVDSLQGEKQKESFILTPESAKKLTQYVDTGMYPDFSKEDRIAGEYPQYQNIMEEVGQYIDIEVNAKYLKEMAEFYEKFSTTVSIRVPVKNNYPIIFNGENKTTKQKAKGLLMPLMK